MSAATMPTRAGKCEMAEAVRPDSETYIRDEALEGPQDGVAETLPTVPAELAPSVEKRSERLPRLAAAAVVWLKGKGMDVTRSSLVMASEEVDDDPTRVPRSSIVGDEPSGMPPPPPAADGVATRPARPRYRGFCESAIDSNDAVRKIYEANAKPSNLSIGRKRGRKASRKRGVMVVPAHVMRRLKRDIARDYLVFRRLAERRRKQLVHANAVILELRKTQHRKDAKKEVSAAKRSARPSNDR